jgi:hypothetical protein
VTPSVEWHSRLVQLRQVDEHVEVTLDGPAGPTSVFVVFTRSLALRVVGHRPWLRRPILERVTGLKE